MSEALFPHFKVLFAKDFRGIGWPSNHLREDEVRKAINGKVVQMAEKHDVTDIISADSLTDALFSDFLEKSVLRMSEEEWAGTYFTFNTVQFQVYAAKLATDDPVAKKEQRIGPRYFPDVFDGFRSQNSSSPTQPLSTTFIEGKPWSSLKVSKPTRDEIQEKAKGLVAAIEQADFDEQIRANALARANAVVSLLEASDPPWRQIVDLLNNEYLCALLNGMAILQLIIGSFS